MEKYPTALYVHYISHSLNLVLSNAVDLVPIRNSFDVKVYTFFNTQKRQIVLKNQIQLLVLDINKTKLVRLCTTR